MSEPGALDQLRRWFEKSGVPVGDAISREEELAALEARTGLTLPADFRRYLLELSPSEENYDLEEGNWWPIARIRTIPEEYRHDVHHPEVAAASCSYLFFADFSIWAWAWAISCTTDRNRGRVVKIGGSPKDDCFVAENFNAFVETYLRDPFML